jgi:3-deoxy-manno-octulosonate cytidylyltransferase (CMP-KDO synthetase)
MGARVVVIIPARYESTRLPGKPLADLNGQPMIQRVYQRAARAPGIERVLVATDDARIRTAVEGFGGEVVMTRADHRSGTDRIAEVAAGLDAEVIVNVQGDLPLLDPAMVAAAAAPLGTDPGLRHPSGGESLGDKHIGLYVYRRDFLLAFAQLAPTPLEQAERLEQLRALEWGFRIKVTHVESASIEVDTARDLERARAALMAATPG